MGLDRSDFRHGTRISSIRTTSFAFEGIIEAAPDGRLVAENVSVHVWLDGASGAPVRVGEEFRRLVSAFEGSSLGNRSET